MVQNTSLAWNVNADCPLDESRQLRSVRRDPDITVAVSVAFDQDSDSCENKDGLVSDHHNRSGFARSQALNEKAPAMLH